MTMTSNLESELREYFKGLKRTHARNAHHGKRKVKRGKDPLSFSLYKFLCSAMLVHPNKDMTFCRAYMVLAWNLMCRSHNAFGIRHSHMEWRNDALCIFFAHMKNDQTGDRPRDPRHIYANPLEPSICPILALGIFWATTGFDESDLLFSGGSQYERFRKALHRLLCLDTVTNELNRRGIMEDNVGTHSLRKEAATYCSSGSTACPSSTAVHLRAGWTLGGVQNTYLRYEAAGDQYVGRTVAGLPLESPLFSILAPHFQEKDDIVEKALHLMFPRFQASYCSWQNIVWLPWSIIHNSW